MNIFVTDPSPYKSAQVLPDKHLVKMPLETCQMLSIVAYKESGQDFGKLPKKGGGFYKTEKGAFRNHPCTIWAQTNFYWLIEHGLALCSEYTYRYNKVHTCQYTIEYADMTFPSCPAPVSFVFAGFDEFKYDNSIDTFTKYKRYINAKPWVKDNYLRKPERKPDWIT